MNKQNLGQYFTTNVILKNKLYSFILNEPKTILEPSIGQGDLIEIVLNNNKEVKFDMYEIDNTIQLLKDVAHLKQHVKYSNFLKESISKKYTSIIGNPPYVKTKNGNLYIQFIQKCYDLLEYNGELIFIVPSDFLKSTTASSLLDKMMTTGTFTHIFHPNKENMFENASIDIIIFRYCLNEKLDKLVEYNGTLIGVNNVSGTITFGESSKFTFGDIFDIYVGQVSGKESAFKNNILGNVAFVSDENKLENYILINKFPCENELVNEHLLKNKTELLARKIRQFNENNWFEWGALRNIKIVEEFKEKNCIYIKTLTRNDKVSFVSKVNYFSGNLLLLIPKRSVDLNKISNYMNSSSFKQNYTFSGRFKIAHRQLTNTYLPDNLL